MTLEKEYAEFIGTSKLVLKTKLSKNPETLASYRIKLIEANNKLIKYIKDNYHKRTRSEQSIYDNYLEKTRNKLIDCLERLNCSHTLGAITEIVSIDDIGPPTPIFGDDTEDTEDGEEEEEVGLNVDKSSDQTSIDQANASTSSVQIKRTELIDNLSQKTVQTNNDQLITKANQTPKLPINTPINNSGIPPINTNNTVNINITMDAAQFLRLAAAQINRPYSGDPLALAAFIDGISLLETLATTPALSTLLYAFAKTKLEGKAREYITDDVTTLALLKNTLTENIKPDNSKIIEGRMLSLRFNIAASGEFAEKAEQLSDALRRTLIVEGMTARKANEIAIEKTIEACRKNTFSDMIKSVLESCTFTSPKEVIAKMITQVDKVKNERQINNTGKGKNNNNNNNANRSNGNWQNKNNNRRNNNNQNNQGNSGRYNNNNRQHNSNNQNNNNQNNRGRQNNNNNHNRNNNGGNNSNFNNNSNFTRYNNGNNNNQNIRYVQGNGQAPAQQELAGNQSEF